VLDRLLSQKQQQIDFIGHLLEQVDTEERDLVDAERSNLDAARQRIGEIDRQIEPLQQFEATVAAHQQSASALPVPSDRPRGRVSVSEPAAPAYRSAGEFVVDILRARGFYPVQAGDPTPGSRFRPADPEAAARLARAVSNQTTTDTPGLLPVPIVGQVVDLIDASRPLITSLGGAKAMGGIPGKSFERPKITQHTQSGAQSAEKTQLPSRQMTISALTFNKTTHGGTVNVSRQDIDWTSPAAWDILVRDLANVYAVDTETTAATAFAAAITTNTTAVATNDLAGWAKALYTAAGKVYAGALRLPDRVWCSVDMWGAMGAIVDIARLALPPGTDQAGAQPGALGEADLADFGGYVLQLPRYVVPTFPAGTLVVGCSMLYEVYEETIGLLSVVEPSILGVEVAYGGYLANGMLEEKGFCKITSAFALAEEPAAGGASGSGSGTKK
jgi:HK97 family phage major capsid protein